MYLSHVFDPYLHVQNMYQTVVFLFLQVPGHFLMHILVKEVIPYGVTILAVLAQRTIFLTVLS